MKRIITILLLGLLSLRSYSQDSLSYLNVCLGQDSYFGFYVCAAGGYSLTKRTTLTVYTNYWANPAFGNAAAGTDFWTELGGGLNFSFLEGKLNVNPSVGFTYGKVLSGGKTGVLGDGIVPTLCTTYASDKLDINAGGVWFKCLRKEGPVTVDYLWFWFYPGYKLNNKVTAGLHAEDFYLSRMSGSTPTNLYLWIGPYLQFNFPKGIFLKAAGGYDAVGKSFIKMNIAIPVSR